MQISENIQVHIPGIHMHEGKGRGAIDYKTSWTRKTIIYGLEHSYPKLTLWGVECNVHFVTQVSQYCVTKVCES